MPWGFSSWSRTTAFLGARDSARRGRQRPQGSSQSLGMPAGLASDCRLASSKGTGLQNRRGRSAAPKEGRRARHHRTTACCACPAPGSSTSRSPPRGWSSKSRSDAGGRPALAAVSSCEEYTTAPRGAGATSTSAASAALSSTGCGASPASTAGSGSRRSRGREPAPATRATSRTSVPSSPSPDGESNPSGLQTGGAEQPLDGSAPAVRCPASSTHPSFSSRPEAPRVPYRLTAKDHLLVLVAGLPARSLAPRVTVAV